MTPCACNRCLRLSAIVSASFTLLFLAGVFNSWNRQIFYHGRGTDGQLSATPFHFVIRDKFLISNYGSGYGVDNYDGSAYYEIYGNVFVGGSGLKSDYSGHDKNWHSNLGIGLGLPCGAFTTYKAGHEDSCWKNTFISTWQRALGYGHLHM
jgi:hypothetical protein